MDRLLEELVALERSALDRWIKLDPQGYLDLLAPEVTYFDPFTERRVDGLDAMQVRLAPMKKMKPPFTDPRYDMIDPKPLVVHTAGIEAAGFLNVQLRASAIVR